MKKLFALVLMMTATISFAQLKVTDAKNTSVQVGEFKQLGKVYATLVKEDGFCFLTYRDDNFSTIDHYKTFTFKESDLDALYELFGKFDGIEKGTEKRVELELGHVLNITYGKMLGKMYAEVNHTDRAGVTGKMRWMNDKQLKQLFGKK